MEWACWVVMVGALASGVRAQEAEAQRVPVEVAQVLWSDPMPCVVELEAVGGEGAFAFRVTEAEAEAIAREARHVQLARPMSHALLARVAEAAGLHLVAVVLKRPAGHEPSFGWLWVEGPQGRYPVSVRGGDGVAVALRAELPLYVVEPPAQSESVPPEGAPEYAYSVCENRPDGPPDDVGRAVSLKAADGRLFHLWVGLAEADSIWLSMPQPFMTRARIHDAIVFMLKEANVPLRRVEIGRIVNGAIHASLVLGEEGAEVEVDCRASDGLAIAERAPAPIFVTGDTAAGLQAAP